MTTASSIYERWHEVAVAGAPQILTCTNCVLLDWRYDDLAAPFWRWYWNDRPGAYLILPRARVPIEPGRAVLIPPHTVFGTGCRGPVGHLYVHFALGLDRAASPGRVFQHHPQAAERALIRRLVRAMEAADTLPLETSFLVHAVINASLAAIPTDYWEGRLTDVRITRALHALGGDDAGCDNAALARAAGMNANAFVRKFVHATGHTPRQYRQRLRVERAASWLREGRLSIDEIAAAAGFCDRFHFSRVFKRITGTSPGRYRRAAPTGETD